MALGGGTWQVQNKVLPGSYVNFVSVSKASAALSDRGVATMPLSMDWGPEQQVITVESGDFQKNSLKLFGHSYTDEAMKPLRELFANTKTLHLFRLNAGGTKASNDYAEAKYPGTLGNSLRIVIEENEAFQAEENLIYDVSTYLGNVLVDMQQGIKAASELKPNDYVTFKTKAALAKDAGKPLTSGTDGTVENAAYQTYLDKMESYTFNTMGCATTDDTLKGLFVAYTKRRRDEMGVKFQTVLFRQSDADYEGIISVENTLVGQEDDPSMVYWVTGAQAGCAVNQSLTNRTYNGEYTPETSYTQTQLEQAIEEGKFIFHQVDGESRVLTDNNTFVSISDEKGEDFSSNQIIRVLDQIGNDIAALFGTKYLGKIPNDNAGRVSLWNDIVKHHQQLQEIRAIENFTSDSVTVAAGDSKKSVIVTDYVTPVGAMEKLYMTVIIQ